MIVKMECPHSQESLSELAEILKREVSAELICEELKSLGSGGVLLLAFEKYYFRNGSYASLTVMITEDCGYQSASIIGSGGGEGILNVSWGAIQSFANMALNTLQDYGFRQIYR